MALLVAWQSDWSEVDGTLIAERSEHKGITGFPRHGGKRHPCRDDGGREIARCLVCSQSEALTTLIHQRRLTPSCSSSGECAGLNIGRQGAAQVTLIEDDNVIETLAPDVRPAKAGVFSRSQTCWGKSQAPRSLDAVLSAL